MEELSLKQAFRWPLVFMLALGGLHWAISVPKSEMIERKHDDGKKKKPKKKKSKQPEWEKFDKEHRDQGFARTHEPVMHFAYSVAHAAAFEGIHDSEDVAESYLEAVECRRFACKYELCGPRRNLTQVTKLLRTLEHEDDDLFDAYESKSRKSEEDKKQICHRIVVRFSRPSPEVKGIRVQKEALAKLRKSQEARKRAKQKAAERKAAKREKMKKKTAPAEAPPSSKVVPKKTGAVPE